MIIYQGDASTWDSPADGAAVAIGVFDGVHLGHRRVLDALDGSDRRLTKTAMTFGTHPAAVLAPEAAPTRLGTLARRFELFEEAGIEAVAVLNFDDAMRDVTPEAFVDRFLVDGLDARFVAVGRGFRFGRNASGTTDTLAEMGAARGFSVEVVDIECLEGREIRSTAVREDLRAGRVASAAALLGRPYDMEGIVVPGDGRGRQLGVPTANISFPAVLTVPLPGVYAVLAVIDGIAHHAVANLGTRPTFDGTDQVLEVHVLDLDRDLYGTHIRVLFVERIRDERRFTSIDDLLVQIRDDIATAASVLSERTP
jgi:riboflavin kinase/FMN adenylyltransferase